MLNWPLHGNDWHHGLQRAFAGVGSAEQGLFLEMQKHSHRFRGPSRSPTVGCPLVKLSSDSGSRVGSRAMPYWAMCVV